MGHSIPRRAPGADIIGDEGYRQCLALNSQGIRCKHRVGPDQMVCGVHPIRISLAEYLTVAKRRRAPSLYAALSGMLAGDAPSRDAAVSAISKINSEARVRYDMRLDIIRQAGWSVDEIDSICCPGTAASKSIEHDRAIELAADVLASRHWA